MPKSIVVDPKEVRKSGKLTIKDIPLNQYKPDIEGEIKRFGKEGLKKMYWFMVLIREFETMLDSIKKQGNYQGIEYNHRGPAHLSIGQESASVGQCFVLDTDDFIFGSHRSHGEILAKCFSAVDKLDDKKLQEIMNSYLDGDTAKALEIQLTLNPLVKALFSEVNPIPVKTALNMIGINAGVLRMPLSEMSADKAVLLKKELMAIGFDIA